MLNFQKEGGDTMDMSNSSSCRTKRHCGTTSHVHPNGGARRRKLPQMEFGIFFSLSDGGASALMRVDDIVSHHQMKTNQENGLLGSSKICNACTGHRAAD
jgi:hypothetical protein